MTSELPQRARDVVSAIPQAGTGFHNWMFRAARVLWKYGRSESDIRALLENAASNCGRFVPGREIDDAVRNSQVVSSQLLIGKAPRSVSYRPWPALNREQREAVIAAEGVGVVDLWEQSPIRFEDAEHCEHIVDALFPNNPLLCCGKTSANFDTRPRSQWRGKLAAMQFLVPSPMGKWVGQTKDGRQSAHCLDATGPRKFLVIEQDTGSPDEQAAVLWHLKARAPLVLVVHSGGKSIHGWFSCSGQDEEKTLRPFMQHAVSLGADPATWTRSQFVRMPDGSRSGRRQRVYYFRPEGVK